MRRNSKLKNAEKLQPRVETSILQSGLPFTFAGIGAIGPQIGQISYTHALPVV